MSEDYSALDVTEADRTPSASSGTDHVDLAAELGCTEMRPKVWDLAPGDAMSYHRQREQEELYYVLSGPARIRIGDDRLDVSEGTAIRIPPETPRQVFNDTEEDHRWLIVGAPPAENDGEVIGED
ncbi:cupin domain-containing protein [Halalkalicoccus sp. NIPERK01]|uniref:cupin domain-containing protein n=1 Tax=Halalkalicoccus sp. NIPERK01 TaxID=3053469 RepID=UPI00256EB423|nr:cupin domain-containing protein [Halalkalicoccus sp. NIPERK01]MDL5361979.1 cupin domain-containing protein [Halalkalicoccus sp. NIPERK01]